VVAQFTLALVLVAGATLMVRSLLASQVINGDMPRQEIMTARAALPDARYPDRAARLRFYDDALARLSRVPGVTVAAVMSQVPGLGSDTRNVVLEGAPVEPSGENRSSRVVVVSPGYFRMFDLPVTEGRMLDDRDGGAGREVAVVTAEFARRFGSGASVIGTRFRFEGGDAARPWLTVVGVSADIVQGQRETRSEAVAFLPHRQDEATGALLMAVRATGDASRLTGALRSTVQDLDADLALFDVRTFQGAIEDAGLFFRVFSVVFSIFGAAALVMAAMGLYAVMAQATARRTREIGIRMALGATPARVLRTVMRRGVVQLAIGLVLGLGLAFAATGSMRSLLFAVAPYDPVSFATSAGVLVAAGLFACWLPAWRAAKLPPVQALASEER
jgi:predicted permease